MSTLTLQEYQTSDLGLSLEDARWIEGTIGTQIRLWQEPGIEGYRLNPGPHVGVVVLPSGTRLECQPKVGVSNFFYMLAVAFDLDPSFRNEVTTFQQIDEVFEFIIRYFAELVQDRIKHGLYRAYQEREENLATVRGRIATREDMRLNHILRHRTYCRFTEFTWDIPENQIIRQVAHLVSGWVTTNDLRQRLRTIDRTLFEVTPTHFPASVLDGFTYHRLNEDYRPIHRLCRLFLAGSTLSEDEGQFDFRTFLFDMNDLFEKFITSVLRNATPPGFNLDAQYSKASLDHAGRIQIRPDLLLASGANRLLVGDCKYKKIGEDQFKNHDFYQMISYCTALALEEGVLIYPEHEHVIDERIAIANSPIRIHQVTVDLNKPRDQLEAELERLAERVWGLARKADSSVNTPMVLAG